MKSAALVATLVSGVLVAGCGAHRPAAREDDSFGSSSSGSESFPDNTVPACSQVWHTGATLPASYDDTCAEGDGTTVGDDGYVCADGTHIALYQHGSTSQWAVPGHKIRSGTHQEFATWLITTCRPPA